MKENIKLLKEKKVFAIIGKLPNLTHLINENGLNDIKISGILQTKFKMRLLVNANNPILLSILNKTINKITYKEKLRINSKYNLIKYEKEDYSWIYKFVLPLLVIIMIFAYFNIEMRKEIKKRKVMERRLERYANKDSLTKVYNRRKIELQLRIETKRAKRFNNDLSVIFFDIDNFKVINDKFGHEAGDYVLIELSQNIFKNLRETDYIGRWGGEEFIIILPETNNKKAFTVASHLKEKISKIDFSITKNVTLSYGITQYIKGDTIQDMIKRSDEAMYFVKKRGKDNIKIM
jgi:polar amino acid transport system substrate-binding protein